jgi:DNA polymerase-3 subunit beta
VKLVIERDHALKALSHVQSIARGKGAVPILANVKLDAGPGGLTFTANNTNIQASDCARAEVQMAGATTVDASALFNIVRAWPSGGQVAMEIQEDGRLAVRCARSRYLLTTLPAVDFPVFAALDDGRGGMIERDVLARLLTRTRFACAQEETKYLMTGVWLHTTEDDAPSRLIAVATDKVSMAVAEAPAPAGFVLSPGVLVPAIAADEITRLLGSADDYVELRFSKSLFELRCGTTEIVGKLLDLQGNGWFDWPIAFKQGEQFAAQLDTDLMQACIGRVLLVSDDKLRTVDMAFGTGSLELFAKAEQGGSHLSESIDIGWDAPDRSIRVNAKKLKDILGHIEGESAVFHVPDIALNAIMVTDSADAACRYMIIQHRGT